MNAFTRHRLLLYALVLPLALHALAWYLVAAAAIFRPATGAALFADGFGPIGGGPAPPPLATEAHDDPPATATHSAAAAALTGAVSAGTAVPEGRPAPGPGAALPVPLVPPETEAQPTHIAAGRARRAVAGNATSVGETAAPPAWHPAAIGRARAGAAAALGCAWTAALLLWLGGRLLITDAAEVRTARAELLVLAALTLAGLAPLLASSVLLAHPVGLYAWALGAGWALWAAMAGVAGWTALWVRKHHRAELWRGMRPLRQLAASHKPREAQGYTAAQMLAIPTPVREPQDAIAGTR